MSISTVPEPTSLNKEWADAVLRVLIFERIKQGDSSGLEASCVSGNNGKPVFERGRGHQ